MRNGGLFCDLVPLYAAFVYKQVGFVNMRP